MKTMTMAAILLAVIVQTTNLNGIELEGLRGELSLNGRLRYEMADQDGLEGSDALTYRLRLGYRTELTEGVSLFAEGEATMDTGAGEYDGYPGTQGIANHTVIADPQNLELNRLQVEIDFAPLTGIAGRQRIIRNNARFIGNVGWRQNEQTYDAVSVNYTAEPGIQLYYAYLDQANRIFGRRANVENQRKFEMESHIIEAQFNPLPDIKGGLYGYLLGMKNAAAASSDTLGVWVTGRTRLMGEDLAVNWRLEAARQTDNRFSPDDSDFDLGYYHLSAAFGNAETGTITIGYESLEGNGNRGFSTPLATLHAHNGFADVFLSTPAEGLTDLYFKADAPIGDNLKAGLVWHTFNAESGPGDYGDEIDLVCGYKLNADISLTAKFAFYDGESGADRTKLWLQMDMAY